MISIMVKLCINCYRKGGVLPTAVIWQGVVSIMDRPLDHHVLFRSANQPKVHTPKLMVLNKA